MAEHYSLYKHHLQYGTGFKCRKCLCRHKKWGKGTDVGKYLYHHFMCNQNSVRIRKNERVVMTPLSRKLQHLKPVFASLKKQSMTKTFFLDNGVMTTRSSDFIVRYYRFMP